MRGWPFWGKKAKPIENGHVAQTKSVHTPEPDAYFEEILRQAMEATLRTGRPTEGNREGWRFTDEADHS